MELYERLEARIAPIEKELEKLRGWTIVLVQYNSVSGNVGIFFGNSPDLPKVSIRIKKCLAFWDTGVVGGNLEGFELTSATAMFFKMLMQNDESLFECLQLRLEVDRSNQVELFRSDITGLIVAGHDIEVIWDDNTLFEHGWIE